MPLDKVKPISIGIVTLLLISLVFNFVPFNLDDSTLKDSKNPKVTETTKEIKQENKVVVIEQKQDNIALIQKNIDFLKANLEHYKTQQETQSKSQENAQEPKESQEEQIKSILQIAKDSTTNSQDLAKDLAQDSTNCKRTKPQLAIIIDDISTQAQLDAIKNIDYKITPSIFPKSKATPHTPQIAKNAPFFMVHLPLEALNFYQEGHEWLFVGDSLEKMESTIAKIKKDFPNLRYINNHTGSKFTQDKESMEMLLKTLEKNNINFIDSRTIKNTATSAFYAKNKDALLNPCQQVFLQRDIFLDNELDVTKITNNLLEALKVAKTKGYAIAIGHPHKETLLALKNAESYLKQSGISLVFTNEIITH